tara:strand:+ start:490 stop:852 length:363 start_codon:yes stop_codon:yes gene_type:complete
MICGEKETICNTCPLKANKVCIKWTKVCVGMKCPINAFEDKSAIGGLVNWSIKPVQKIEVEKAPANLEDIFFGIKKGKLPDKYKDLKISYLNDKNNLGKGCSQCKLNGLISQYKKKIASI